MLRKPWELSHVTDEAGSTLVTLTRPHSWHDAEDLILLHSLGVPFHKDTCPLSPALGR